MVQYNLLEAHSLSQWYTILPYWPSGYPYGTLLSSICPMDIFMVHYTLLLSHWISLWYTSIFYWFTGYPRYTTIFYWPTGYLYGTQQSSTNPLIISMEHSYLLLAHWLSLWYSILSYWPTGYPCGTQSSPIGPLAIPMVHYYLLLALWISLWILTLSYWPTDYLYGTLLSSTGQMAICMVHLYPLMAHRPSVGTLLSATGPLVISMIMSLANSQFCYRYSLECKMIPHSIVKLRLSNDEDLVLSEPQSRPKKIKVEFTQGIYYVEPNERLFPEQ